MLSRPSKSREGGAAETPPSTWRGWIFRRISVVAALLAAAIFGVDLAVPLGIAIGVAYVAVVLLGWWFRKTRHVFLVALACSLLTIVGYFYAPSGAETWIVLTNRIIALCAIWLTAVLVFKTRESAGQALRTADPTERTRIETGLEQARRMAALGRVTAGVAHEFNNQLLTISGFARLLQRAAADGTTEKTWIDNILTATGQAGSLTDKLLAFGGKQVMAPKVLGIAGAMRDVKILLRPMIDASIVVECAPNDEQARVKVDPGALSQALLDLAINASDAMPDGGVLTLSSRVVQLDRADLAGFEDARPGAFVAASVSDTGSGIDEAVRKHVFEPFFTTRDKGSGTGLGLSMVYGMARQCGGAIALDSRPGGGTTVTIYLPAVEEAVTEAVPVAAPAQRGGGETVLVAEDEAMVRDFLKASLEKLGYRVLMAEEGTAAQRIFHEQEGRIDLLVTDMAMPGLSGRQLARDLMATQPDLKVLYITGHDAFGDGGWSANEDETVILKPFSLDDLGRTVRELLDR